MILQVVSTHDVVDYFIFIYHSDSNIVKLVVYANNTPLRKCNTKGIVETKMYLQYQFVLKDLG